MNDEEKQLLRDFEADEFKSVLSDKRKKQLQAAAAETLKSQSGTKPGMSGSELKR